MNEYQAPNGCDEEMDEEAEHAAFRDAVSAWRSAGQDQAGVETAPYKTEPELMQPLFGKKPVPAAPAAPVKVEAKAEAAPALDLNQGMLDEAKEREVKQWGVVM